VIRNCVPSQNAIEGSHCP